MTSRSAGARPTALPPFSRTPKTSAEPRRRPGAARPFALRLALTALIAAAGAGAPARASTDAAAPARPAGYDPDTVVPRPPTSSLSYAARLVTPVVVRRTPSNRGRRVAVLRPYGSWNGGPVVLQVVGTYTINGYAWLRVRLPTRPNGATGWIPRANTEIRRLRYRILISRSAHRLTLLRDGRRVRSTRVVVGAPGTPTPAGRFAVLEVVRQPKGSVIGPWALHLTAHSDVLDNYGGGPGRVALHGRSGPLLADPLGTSRSHGCIRMSNAFVAMLRRVAVEGTPVVIT